MLSGLLAAEAIIVVSIVVKALTYATTLLAIGSPLLLVSLVSLEPPERRFLAISGALCAVAAIVLTFSRIPVRASFLMGGTLEGAADPMMLGLVADSPLGSAVAIRMAGLVLTLCVLLQHPWARLVGCVGAALAAGSFALRGHALGEPRDVLAILVTLHILCVAYWLSALMPLIRATIRCAPEKVGLIAGEFGDKAIWIVAGLAIAGAATLGLLGMTSPAAWFSPYGQGFAVKILVFCAVLGCAALNKLRLTPALLSGDQRARASLGKSVGVELALISVILLTTAAITEVAAPPKAV